MKVLTLALLALLVAQPSFAAKVEIKSTPVKKKIVSIDISENTADELKFIAVKKVVVADCNQRSYEVAPVITEGSGNGFYDSIYVNESVSMTVMGCPREKETIIVKSQPMTFKTFKLPDSGDKVLRIYLTVDADTQITLVP